MTSQHVDKLVCKADAPIRKRESGRVSIHYGATPDKLVDTGFNLTVLAEHGDVDEGARVLAAKIDGVWIVQDWEQDAAISPA